MLFFSFYTQENECVRVPSGDQEDETTMTLSGIESGFRHTRDYSETSSQVDVNDL